MLPDFSHFTHKNRQDTTYTVTVSIGDTPRTQEIIFSRLEHGIKDSRDAARQFARQLTKEEREVALFKVVTRKYFTDRPVSTSTRLYTRTQLRG